MKVICIGRNYAEHAKELGNAIPDKPVIFLKPDTAVLRDNKDFYYPEFTQNLHFECELVVRVRREGKFIDPKFARSYLDGVGLGIDMTARDLQDEAKKKGLPWTLAKCFNDSAPVSEMLPLEDFPDLQDLHFTCRINGEVRQQGHTADMINSVAEMVGFVSQFITLKKGDLLFTGTPAGVGPLAVGDHIEGFLGERQLLNFRVK